MKILFITGSNRKTGKHSELIGLLEEYSLEHRIQVLELSDLSINACQACEACRSKAKCVLPDNDDFDFIVDSMIETDLIFMVIPVYAPIPSKFAALLERLIATTFFGCQLGDNKRPLLDKEVAVLQYDSQGIIEDKKFKIMIQQLFTDDYSFDRLTYDFLDIKQSTGLSLLEYTADIIKNLDKRGIS